MRMDSRLYRIRTKEYLITIGLCANICRKSVEEQGMRVGARATGGADRPHLGIGRPHQGPASGALSVWCLKTLPIFLLNAFSNKYSYQKK